MSAAPPGRSPLAARHPAPGAEPARRGVPTTQDLPLAARSAIMPAHRLAPSPDGGRRMRRLITVAGSLVVMLVVLALAAMSLSTWLAGRGFSPVPAVISLGSPGALSLVSDVGDVRVLPSNEVDALTLALVAPGATTSPADDALVEAQITRTDGTGRTTVEVRQPARSVGTPFADGPRDLLLLVPTGLDLALEVRTTVGDMVIDGELASLDARTEAGDLRLGPLTAPRGVRVSAGTGDIDLELGSPAPTDVDLSTSLGDVDVLLPTDAGGEVAVSSGLGDVEIAVPGTARWKIDATADVGEVSTAPGLDAVAGTAVGTLTVTADLGDIHLTR